MGADTTETATAWALHVHHVGGRDGEIGEVALNPQFGADCFTTIYEADERAHAQILEVNEARGRHARVVAHIVADADAPSGHLNINYCPCASSTLESGTFGPTDYTANELLGDYLFADVFRTVERLHLPFRSIDSLCREHGWLMNVLSADTQGSESRVIAGATDQLRDHGIAILCEVEFVELYRDQPLFGDVASQAAAIGFDFVRLFDKGNRMSRFRGPIGWRGEGIAYSADALFVKPPPRIAAENQEPQRDLLKCAFFALHFGLLELALEALELAFEGEVRGAPVPTPAPAYVNFLRKLFALYRATPKFNLPAFTELFSHEEAMRRFDTRARHPWAEMDLPTARRNYFRDIDLAVFRREFPKLLSDRPTPLETLLTTNGFAELATLLRDRRMKHASVTAKMLQIADLVDGRVVFDFGAVHQDIVGS